LVAYILILLLFIELGFCAELPFFKRVHTKNVQSIYFMMTCILRIFLFSFNIITDRVNRDNKEEARVEQPNVIFFERGAIAFVLYKLAI